MTPRRFTVQVVFEVTLPPGDNTPDPEVMTACYYKAHELLGLNPQGIGSELPTGTTITPQVQFVIPLPPATVHVFSEAGLPSKIGSGG